MIGTSIRALATILVPLLLGEVRFYSVEVTKTQQDVYSFKDNARRTKGVVVTERCYHYAWSEPAVIRFEPGSRDNRILFSKEGDTCTVKSLTVEVPPR